LLLLGDTLKQTFPTHGEFFFIYIGDSRLLLLSLQMPRTHSTDQLLLWLVYRRGPRLLLLLFVNALLCRRCRHPHLLLLDPRYNRILLVWHSLQPCQSLTLVTAVSFFYQPSLQPGCSSWATRIDPIDTNCFVNSSSTTSRNSSSLTSSIQSTSSNRFHWHAADPFFKPLHSRLALRTLNRSPRRLSLTV